MDEIRQSRMLEIKDFLDYILKNHQARIYREGGKYEPFPSDDMDISYMLGMYELFMKTPQKVESNEH